MLILSAKYRAQAAGVPFDLKEEDISLPEVCPALGIPLLYGGGRGDHRQDTSATLDRLVPARGYVKDNVVVISDLANRIKSSASSEQVLKVGDWLRSIGL